MTSLVVITDFNDPLRGIEKAQIHMLDCLSGLAVISVSLALALIG
jgi:hypothetical protein